MQIVLILRTILYTTLSQVRLVTILQFSEHFQLIFDNNVNNEKRIKQKMANIFCKLFRIIKFFFLILLRLATLESIVSPTNRKSSAFLFHTNKIFSNVEQFSIFSQSFLKTILAPQNKNNVVATISRFVYQLPKKYCLHYVFEHLKYYLQINEY